MSRNGSRVMVGKVDHLGVIERALGHDLCMPVGRPAFVHDFGLSLRREVVRLLANHPQDVALPGFERAVFDEEQQNVFLRLFGETAAPLPFFLEFLLLLVHELLRIDEVVHVFARRDLLDDDRFFRPFTGLRLALDEHRMMIDEVVDRQADIDETFDGVQAVLVDVFPHLRGVVRHGVHHFAIRLREPDVVLEEVAMPVNVGHHDFLIDQMIALEQVGVARVIVDDHFIDFVQAVRVALVEPLVLHAELPVGISVREPAVSGHHIHLFEIENFEKSFVEVEPVLASVYLDLAVDPR